MKNKKEPEYRNTGGPDKKESVIRNPHGTEGPQSTMAKWAVWFTVEGDLRFLSHRNIMSLCERSAARAELPIKFSEGFNPRPKLSLPLPRPVGVASRCELLIIELERDTADPALRLGEQFPEGIKLIKSEPLPDKPKVQIRSVTYELTLRDTEQERIKTRLASLKQAPKWEVPRRRSPDDDKPFGAAHDKPEKLTDIKGQIGSIGISSSGGNEKKLSFTLTPKPPAGPIGPERVLRLLELTDITEALAEVEKTSLECVF